MKTIEITTRLRVPDDAPGEQVDELNRLASVAARSLASTVLAAAGTLKADVTLVEPLQDVIVYEARS